MWECVPVVAICGKCCEYNCVYRIYTVESTAIDRRRGQGRRLCATMQTFEGSVHSAKIDDPPSKSRATGGYFEKKNCPFFDLFYIVITLHSRPKYLRGPVRENRITKPFLRIIAEYFFAQKYQKTPYKNAPKTHKNNDKTYKNNVFLSKNIAK